MMIKFLNSTLGITRPWLVVMLLALACVASGLIVYAVQHVRMTEVRDINRVQELIHVKEIALIKETNLKQLKEMEKKLKSTTVTVEKILPDGSKTTEVREDIDLTENIVVKTEVIEVIKEVI